MDVIGNTLIFVCKDVIRLSDMDNIELQKLFIYQTFSAVYELGHGIKLRKKYVHVFASGKNLMPLQVNCEFVVLIHI